MYNLYCKVQSGLTLAFVLAVLALATTPVRAQRFEAYYGERTARDAGQDVKSVNFCFGGGSVLAGSRRTASATEILVTRVDDQGNVIWQYAYSIAGSLLSSAQAIVEVRDGSGFALTGSVRRPGGVFLHVLRIDCNGYVRWARVFNNQALNHRSSGYDIIETDNGSPWVAGDLIAVGDETFLAPTGSTQGRMVRLSSFGTTVFDLAYREPMSPLGLRFRAVTESASNGGSRDLFVAGSAAFGSNWDRDRRAMMLRVHFDGTPICSAAMGLLDDINEDFHGITTLSSNSSSGPGTVLVGASSSAPSGAMPLYMARFHAFGCQPMLQSLWNDPVDDATAFDVSEGPIGFGPASIIVVGTLSGTNTPGDGFSLSASLFSLAPIAQALRYSTHSNRAENIVSIDLNHNGFWPEGFVLAGSTRTDWDGTGDGQDFYLVHTDQNRNTPCSVPWNVDWMTVYLPHQQFIPLVAAIPLGSFVPVTAIYASDAGYCCGF